jgi:TldD protein
MNVPTVLSRSNIDALGIARDLILRPSGLDDGRLDRIFAGVLTHSVDFADLYFQLSHEEAWSLEDGIVKDGSASIEQGVGVRALAGEKTGFAYSDEIVLPALEEAARAARAIAVQGGNRQLRAWESKIGHELYLPADPSAGLTDQEKVAWLERVDRETRRLDPRIVHVTASVTAVHEVVLIATSDGELAADVRPLVRFNVSVLV